MILKRFILVEGLRKDSYLPSERQLSEAFGVSHRVIREALSTLVGEGIIDKQQGRGTFVKALDPNCLRDEQVLISINNIVELYRLRSAIEVGAVSLAAIYATDEDLAELQKIIKDMQPKAARGDSLVAEEMRFHLALLRASHSEVFQEQEYLVVEAIRFKMYDDPDRLYHSSGNPKTMQEHENIVDALRKGDASRAMLELYTHLTRNISAIKDNQGRFEKKPLARHFGESQG